MHEDYKGEKNWQNLVTTTKKGQKLEGMYNTFMGDVHNYSQRPTQIYYST